MADSKQNNLEERVLRIEKYLFENSEEEISMAVDPAPCNNYLDLKQEIGNIAALMGDMKASLQKELGIAALNGMIPETGKLIIEMQQKIEQVMQENTRNLNEIAKIEQIIKEHAPGTLAAIKEKVFSELEEIKDNLIDKALSGVAATKSLGEKVRKLNQAAMEKAFISKDTFSTNLEESINQIGRNWMAFNYSRDQVISKSIDKVADTLESVYERGSNVKEVLKDLGRALLGKERQNAKGELTDQQKGFIEQIRHMSQDIKNEMTGLEKSFTLSKNFSVQNLSSAIELRNESRQEMKENNGLKKRFEQAKEASIDSKAESEKSLGNDKKYKALEI